MIGAIAETASDVRESQEVRSDAKQNPESSAHQPRRDPFGDDDVVVQDAGEPAIGSIEAPGAKRPRRRRTCRHGGRPTQQEEANALVPQAKPVPSSSSRVLHKPEGAAPRQGSVSQGGGERTLEEFVAGQSHDARALQYAVMVIWRQRRSHKLHYSRPLFEYVFTKAHQRVDFYLAQCQTWGMTPAAWESMPESYDEQAWTAVMRRSIPSRFFVVEVVRIALCAVTKMTPPASSRTLGRSSRIDVLFGSASPLRSV